VSAAASVAATALALLVLTYDFFLKSTALGPMNMGLCRACNVAVGVSAASPPPVLSLCPGLSAMLPVLAYVAVITYVSRSEDRRPGLRRVVALGVIAIVPLQAAVALAHGHPGAALCVLLLLVPVAILRKLSHVT